MLWTHEAQPIESTTNFDHCDDAYSFAIRVQTTLNHIRFVFYHNIKDNERNLCQDLLTTENADSDLKVYALHYANEALVRVRLSFQKLLQTRSTCRNNKKKMFGKRVMTCTRYRWMRTTVNHISICFLQQYQRQRKCFLRALAEKGIARHIDASSVVWTRIDNGKLPNQITRLAAIVVKFGSESGYFWIRYPEWKKINPNESDNVWTANPDIFESDDVAKSCSVSYQTI